MATSPPSNQAREPEQRKNYVASFGTLYRGQNGIPGGSRYTTFKELGPKYHTIEGIMGPNSLMAVYVNPLGYIWRTFRARELI